MATAVMQSPDLDLAQFVDAYAGKELGRDLISLGNRSHGAYKRVGNEGMTRALLATNFWRAWLRSARAIPLLQQIGASPNVLSEGRTIIVPRRNLNRFDLVVLDPSLPPDFTPQTLDLRSLQVPSQELRSGALTATADGVPPAIGKDSAELAVESFANGSQPYVIVLTAAPPRERLAFPDSVQRVFDGIESSTAGVVVRETAGSRVGVTVALHAIRNTIRKTTSITVNGQRGRLVRSDAVTDSAFVELSKTPASGVRKTNGVLKGLAPRGSQRAEFVGETSGQVSTTIVGWDKEIPTPSLLRQACLYTGRDAQPGDSGAALVTDDHWIVGFAFERTVPGHSPAECSWIWADSVLTALNVELA